MSNRSWWSGSLADFSTSAPEDIVERLALRLVETHPRNHATQINAWRRQIDILQSTTLDLPRHWRVALEYPLLRLGRRLDAVVITPRAILVLEFKIGATRFDQAGRLQVEDYALDLQDFHADSRSCPIVPILVASEAETGQVVWPLLLDNVLPVFEASAKSLRMLITDLMDRLPDSHIAIDRWEDAAYRPVPTIVQAATMLYRKHGVAEIKAARTDLDNLNRTTSAILAVIKDARVLGTHVIVFLTGIPGAGKTLCGLNVVFDSDAGAAFLTGNLPLVHVLREALAREAAGNGGTLRQARQKTESMIQGLTNFVRDNVLRMEPPHEHVVVFDEAQRAWDAAYGARKFQLNDSEAALFLDIMARRQDYAVVLALVGNGQEINTGEAGLAEWGRALAKYKNKKRFLKILFKSIFNYLSSLI